VLSNAPISAVLPAADVRRAKAFYEGTLGLPVKKETDGEVRFECGRGTVLFVYESPYAGTNRATSAGWEVEDIETEVEDLRRRGVTFENYDLPGVTTVDGIAIIGEDKVAWFTDGEGNILALSQSG
jgi:catechol 2,3-dioxygenase-like lactoylglutathione lyase family enzyme